MQDLENDMDDLFRRSAEKYPLSTGQSDWQSLEKKLASVEVSADAKKPERKNNYKKLGLLLLLLFISLIAGFLILNPIHKNYQAGINDDQINQLENLNNKSEIKNNVSPKHLSEESKRTVSARSKNQKTENAPVNTSLEGNKTKNEKHTENNSTKTLSKKNPFKSTPGPDRKNNEIVDQRTDLTEIDKNLNYSNTENTVVLSALPNDSVKNQLVENKDSLGKNPSSTEKKKASPTSKPEKRNRFYAGVMFGPDFSKVKSSPFKNPGFSIGILAGYNLSKTVFLETGFFIDKKYYSSDGKMFDMKNVSMPDNMTINDLESQSKILEIPLNIGYRFYQKRNTRFFVAGGFSTYLMTEEKNNYNVTMNGSPEKMDGFYTKNNLAIPAVINLSAGWEQKISRVLKIRIEPYLKLPVQGIGVGKLPVTSAGIQFGLMFK